MSLEQFKNFKYTATKTKFVVNHININFKTENRT